MTNHDTILELTRRAVNEVYYLEAEDPERARVYGHPRMDELTAYLSENRPYTITNLPPGLEEALEALEKKHNREETTND